MLAQVAPEGAAPHTLGPPGSATPPEREFRTADCDERCRLTRAILPGLVGRVAVEQHSPDAHHAAGWRAAERALGRSATPVRSGPLEIDLGACTATVEGRPLWLTPNEWRMLLALARRPGVMLANEELAAEVWGRSVLLAGRSSVVHLLRVNLSRLRSKLGPAAPLVVTIVGLGVRLDVAAPCDTAPPGGYPRPSRLGGRWAREWDACRECGRTDYGHAAHGRCTSCQARLRAAAAAAAAATRWVKDWDACRECGRTDRRHYGHGYCSACSTRRRRRGTAAMPGPATTRWARHWDACRECRRSDGRHDGHGYCSACTTRRRRRGIS